MKISINIPPAFVLPDAQPSPSNPHGAAEGQPPLNLDRVCRYEDLARLLVRNERHRSLLGQAPTQAAGMERLDQILPDVVHDLTRLRDILGAVLAHPTTVGPIIDVAANEAGPVLPNDADLA
jgi:hypothetical protein